MPQIINTNISSLTAQRNLNKSQGDQATALQRLSSGLRINSAKDDAAGLAISTRFSSQTRGLSVAIRNAGDGISLAQTAEGALGSMTDSLQRVRELALQAANGTNSDTDRQALQAEASQLISEITRTGEQTNFNGRKLLDGSFDSAFQIGANAGETIEVSVAKMTADTLGSSEASGVSAIGTDSALSNGDLSINGTAITPSVSGDDTASTAGASASAISKAAAINRHTDETGVTATVNETVATGAQMTAAATTGDLTINDVAINLATGGASAADDRNAVISAINAKSDQTGVVAEDGGDATGVILKAADGRNIDVALGGTLTADSTGVSTGTSYGGYTLSGQGVIELSGGDGTGNGDVSNAGLMAGSYAAGEAVVNSSERTVAASGTPTPTAATFTTGEFDFSGGTQQINATNSTFNVTVNGVETQVQLNATTDVDGGGALAAGEYDDIDSLVLQVNQGLDDAGLAADVVASASGNSLVFTSTAVGDGNTISVSQDDGTFAVPDDGVAVAGATGGNFDTETIDFVFDGTNELVIGASDGNQLNVQVGANPAVDITVAAGTYTTAEQMVTALNNSLATEGINDQVVAQVGTDGISVELAALTAGEAVVVADPGVAAGGAVALVGGEDLAGTFGGHDFSDVQTVQTVATDDLSALVRDFRDGGGDAEFTTPAFDLNNITNYAFGEAHDVGATDLIGLGAAFDFTNGAANDFTFDVTLDNGAGAVVANIDLTAVGTVDLTGAPGQQALVDEINSQLNGQIGLPAVEAYIDTNAADGQARLALRTTDSANAAATIEVSNASAAWDATDILDDSGAAITKQDLVFDVAVDGGGAQTITLGSDIADSTALLAAVNGQLTGATASITAGGDFSIVSDTTGAASEIELSNVDAADAPVGGSQLGLADGNGVGTDGTDASLQFTIDTSDGNGAQTITLNSNVTDASSLLADINDDLTGATASLDGGTGQLVITSDTGADIVFNAGDLDTDADFDTGGGLTALDVTEASGTLNSLSFNIDLGAGAETIVLNDDLTGQTSTDVVNSLNAAIAGSALNGLVTAGVDGDTGQLTFTSTATGDGASIDVTVTGADAASAFFTTGADTVANLNAEVVEAAGTNTGAIQTSALQESIQHLDNGDVVITDVASFIGAYDTVAANSIAVSVDGNPVQDILLDETLVGYTNTGNDPTDIGELASLLNESFAASGAGTSLTATVEGDQIVISSSAGDVEISSATANSLGAPAVLSTSDGDNVVAASSGTYTTDAFSVDGAGDFLDSGGNVDPLTIDANNNTFDITDGTNGTETITIASDDYDSLDDLRVAIAAELTTATVALSASGDSLVFSTSDAADGEEITLESGSFAITGGSASGSAGVTTATPIDSLDDGDLVINNTSIGASNAADDTASDVTANSSDASASGIAVAAAINRSTDVTGVAAEVNSTVATGGDGSGAAAAAGSAGSVYVNGVQTNGIVLTDDEDLNRNAAISAINAVTGQTGVVAADNGVSITLTAEDGRNISIAVDNEGNAGFGAAIGLDTAEAGINEGDISNDATLSYANVAATTYSTVRLSSAGEIEVEAGSQGAEALDALGFDQGGYGSTESGQFISDIDISTLDGANAALTALDNALNSVSAERANLGAIQNRFETTISNLEITSENLTAANSRIKDADFATETAELARTQVLQQAGISILAQANALPQQALSLLQ